MRNDHLFCRGNATLSTRRNSQESKSLGFTILLWVVFCLVRLLSLTWRVRVSGMDRRRLAVAAHPRGAFLLAVYHEHAIGGLLSHPGQGIACLTSLSKDGEIVAFVCEKIGLRTVRGCSSRGGRQAKEDMIDLLMSGISGAITVDGPKGPHRQAKAGVVSIASKSRAAILPIIPYASSFWTLAKTWDQTKIPKPFSRLLVYYGEPISVPEQLSEMEIEDLKSRVDLALQSSEERVKVQFEQLWSQGRPF